jgi:hypothetical protein
MSEKEIDAAVDLLADQLEKARVQAKKDLQKARNDLEALIKRLSDKIS